MKRPMMRGAASTFAHLLGLSAAKADEEDQDRKQRADESDEDYAKRMEEQDQEEAARKAEEEEKDKEAARKAEEEEKDKEAARKAEEEDEKADAEDKTDDEEGGKRKGRAKGARLRERARCAAIFGCAAAGQRPDMAAHFAFNSDMPAQEAITALNAIAAGEPKLIAAVSGIKVSTLAERMAATAVPNVGADGGGDTPAGVTKTAAAIIAIGEKVRGENAKK